jgi:hypothetical protein
MGAFVRVAGMTSLFSANIAPSYPPSKRRRNRF